MTSYLIFIVAIVAIVVGMFLLLGFSVKMIKRANRGEPGGSSSDSSSPSSRPPVSIMNWISELVISSALAFGIYLVMHLMWRDVVCVWHPNQCATALSVIPIDLIFVFVLSFPLARFLELIIKSKWIELYYGKKLKDLILVVQWLIMGLLALKAIGWVN